MYLNCLLNPATPSLAVLQAGLKKNEDKKEEDRKEVKAAKGALKLVFDLYLAYKMLIQHINSLPFALQLALMLVVLDVSSWLKKVLTIVSSI